VETKINPGDKVYFVGKPTSLRDKPDTEGIVHLTFNGEDNQARVIVKYRDEGRTDYKLLHINAVAMEMGGETFFNKTMKDPKYAFNLAVELGIYNTDGSLTTNYGGEYDLIDGTKFYADDDIQ
jgi:hypothetical protein